MATILLVDDEASVRTFLATVLGSRGHRLLEADDGAAALDRVRAEHPDLVICDVLMPIVDGCEFVRRLRADPTVATTPVIFHTGQYREQDLQRLAGLAGVVSFLFKPARASEVFRVVDSALGSVPAAPPAIPEEFDREHVRLLTGKLFHQVERLQQAEAALQEAHDRLDSVIQNSPLALITLDNQGVVQSWNPAAQQLFGWSEEEVVGRPIPVVPEEERRHFAKLLQGEIAGQSRAGLELRRLRKDGSPVEVSLWTAPIRDARGTITGSIEMLIDITDRKQAERAARESQERFASVVTTAMDAVITIDADQRIVLFNHAAETMFGYRAAEMLGEPLDRLLPERFRQAHPQHIRNFADTPVTSRAMNALSTPYGLRSTGEEFPIEASIAQGGEGRGKLFTVILRDITERRQGVEALRQANERLTQLSRKIIEVQEEERRSLARELHDEIGQVLSAVSVNLKIVQARIDPALRSRLDESVAIVDRAVLQVRNLSLDLRPSVLDDFGLEAALRWYGGRLAEQSALAVHVEAQPLADLPAPTRNACFRVAQEALTNVARHGRARQVWIQLQQQDNEVALTISDDGRGFDVAAALDRAARGSSLGLISMQERVALLGGRLDIDSRTGAGTIVRVRLPLTPT